VVLPEDGSVTLSDVNEGSFTVHGLDVEPGMVLVSGTDAGLARKIVSVSAAGDGYVCATQNAALTDIFQEARIRLKRAITPADLASIEVAPGIQYNAPTIATRDPLEFAFKFEGTYPGAPGSLLSMSTSAEFKAQLELGLDVTIEDGALIDFTYAPSVAMSVTSELNFKGKMEKSYPKFPMDYAVMTIRPLIFLIGPVPVVVSPKVTLSTQLVISVEGGAKIKVDHTARYRSGVTYNAVYDQWIPIDESTYGGTVDPLFNAYIKAQAALSLAKVGFGVEVYGVAGPQISADVGKLTAEWEAQTSPDLSVKRSCSLGFSIAGEVKADIFGKRASFTIAPGLEKKFTFWEKTFMPGEGDIEIRSPGGRR
jgi:hypothetical protein